MSAATSLYTLPFGDISSADHARVGGKCASLGEMTQAGVAVPPGFAVTTDAYQAMLDHHGLRAEIERHLASIGSDDIVGADHPEIGVLLAGEAGVRHVLGCR